MLTIAYVGEGQEKVLCEKSRLLLLRLTAWRTRIAIRSFKLKPGSHATLPPRATPSILPPQPSDHKTPQWIVTTDELARCLSSGNYQTASGDRVPDVCRVAAAGGNVRLPDYTD